TTDVDKSIKLSGMLKRKGVKHELLNAKPEYAAREAEIVAQAGRTGAVTIATNMAGRGTDIILGGNPEYMAWARLKDKYATLLDVPQDEWKATVAEMREKENKVEEHHFDIRKHLLEYDEVMDHQRKRVYGYRQEILDGANCKLRVMEMLTQQIDLALDRYLDDSYGPGSFAELVTQKLNIDCE